MDDLLVATVLKGETDVFVRTLGHQPANGTHAVIERDLLSNAIDGSNANNCSWNVGNAASLIGRVTLNPGESWSYVQAVARPRAYYHCAGIEGGNLCNFAARYAQVADGLGLEIAFVDHQVGDLGAGPEYSVAILWDEQLQPVGGQDLIITNTTPYRVTFTTVGPPERLQVWGVLWN